MRNKLRAARIKVILSMAIFGTIGIFRHYVPFSSGFLAMTRGIAGAVFLYLFCMTGARKQKVNVTGSARWLIPLTGIMIGFNWILLFEAYRYTTVATATLCYYTEPILVMLAAPFTVHEKLSRKKIICVLLAILGVVLISGLIGSEGESTQAIGVFLGLGAAVLYAASILLNKKLCDIPAETRTIRELFSAGVILIPYVLLTERGMTLPADAVSWILLIVICIIHTSLPYFLYFSALNNLPAQSVAIMSYIDPILAVVLSLVILHEPMTLAQAAGSVLLLGTMVISEA